MDAEDRAVEQIDDAVWAWLDAGLTVDALMEHLAGHQGVQDARAAATPPPRTHATSSVEVDPVSPHGQERQGLSR